MDSAKETALFISFRFAKVALVALAALLLALTLPCLAEGGNEGDGAARKPLELGPDGLPKFRHDYDNGLYSTITAMYYCGTPQEYMKQNFHEGKIAVAGFNKPVPIFYIKQNFPAPLVVVLMGGDGEVKGPFGELYPYWFGHAGFNVLTFDNSFTPRFPDYSGRGVVGNFEADTDSAAAIVDAYIKQSDPKNYTRIGVVGLSFGGSQALIMAMKAKQGRLPFELAGCLAMSPPVRLLSTAQLVDGFYKFDRFKTTMVELGKKFGSHVPVPAGQAVPFSDTEMRGAIGFVFRDQLSKVVDRNDRVYRLGMLPSSGGGDDRGTYAEATSLQRYIELYAGKYWTSKGAVASAQEIWEMPNLDRLLPQLPDYAELVVAENDPLNYSSDLAAVKAADSGNHLTVLPRGGHLGFITSEWALVKAHHLFDRTTAPVESVKPASTAVRKAE
jgi:pimeloyl-ACP methyl ester carboxylesterase